jgi:LemA protein
VSVINKRTFAVILVVGMLIVVGLLFILSYNSMVAKSQTVDQNLSQIKNKYVTKVDKLGELLPQVQQYQQFEASTLANITALRSQWMNAIQTNASTSNLTEISSKLDANVSQVILTFEAYPALFSGTLVAQYMGNVVDVNDQLSYARGQYNAAVRDYNTNIKSFPNNMFAGSFGFSERQYWGTDLPDGEVLNL